MSKFIVKFNRDKCKGCELCANACPKKIIAMQPAVNRLGYRPAGVAAELMEQCIGCTSCALVCPDCCIEIFAREEGDEE